MSALEAALDCLLPGGEGYPPAGELGLAAWVAGQERFAAAVAEVCGALPEGFAALDAAARVAALEEVERALPEAFDGFTVAAYSGYYTQPAVLAAIEARHGYKARPPQPGGYALPAFDPAILKVPAARAALWRDPEEERAR
jgi:hypothetical protein